MTVILAFLGIAAFVALLASLIRTVATDGYGTRPTPRSHQEELGSWINQTLTSQPPLKSKDTEAAA